MTTIPYSCDGVAQSHRIRTSASRTRAGIDPRKRHTWPDYAMGSRAKYGCPVALLIVAPDPAVAAWCAEPIETGIPGFVLRPPVLGREAIPIVTDPEEAARRPELGVLSALAHGSTPQAAAIAAAVLPAVRGLDDERSRFYTDLVLSSINDAARSALETMMKGYEYQSDFAKKYVAEGRAEGERAVLLRQLRIRFGELPRATVARIEAAPLVQIEQWVDRVVTAHTIAEVLGEPS